MTVETTTNRVVALGNGATTVFSYNFLIPDADDVVVIYTDTLGQPTTVASVNYTITGLGVPTGGTLTYPVSGSPIAAGTFLTIERILPLLQEDSIANQTFYPTVIEEALDYEMMCIQQLQDEIGRSIMGPVSDPLGLNYTLPAVSIRANNGLAFDALGQPIAGVLSTVPVSAAMQPVFQASSIAVAKALLGIGAPIDGTTETITTDYTFGAGDNGKTIIIGGGTWNTLTGPAIGTLPAAFQIRVFNSKGRAEWINIPGITPFWLWPLQVMIVFNANGVYGVDTPGIWQIPGGATFYVDPGGSDLSDGLSAAQPRAGILTTWDLIRKQTYGAANIQLTVGAVYGAVGELDGDTSGQYGRLIGITGDPTLVNPPQIQVGGSSIGMILRDGAWATLNGIQFGSSGSGSTGVSVQQKALCDLLNCQWATMTGGNHISISEPGARVNITGPQKIVGNAGAHWAVFNGGSLEIGSTTITGNSLLAFPTGFLEADLNGHVNNEGCTFSGFGSIGCPEYAVTHQSAVSKGGVAFPHNSAGSVDASSIVY